jgi:ribosomal peptide maturation radical SAM protein 1
MPRPALLFETSRGCWWGEKAHCTFCGLNGQTMAYRSMEPDKAVELIDVLFKYADSCDCFESVDNILPHHYVSKVFSRVSAPPGTYIFYEVKADLSYDDLDVLAKAGVRRVQPGIESLATSTLRLMKKGTTASQNVQFLRNCVLTGVRPLWNLLVGFPGEQEDVYKKYCADLPLLTHLPPPAGAFPVRFDRFSPYFNKAREYRLDLHPLDYYELVYPFDAQGLTNIAYYFSDHNFAADYAMAMIKWIARVREKVKAWRELWKDDLAGATRPRLQFRAAGGGTVVDSRSGKTIEHEIGASGRSLLESLAKPKSASMIAQEFPTIDVERETQTLRDKGLLFLDGDRLVSLVCPSERVQ